MAQKQGSMLVQLLLLLALAVGTGHGEMRLPPPEPPAPLDPTLSPLELLDLGAAAVRYLRAFTTQCWLPDINAPIAMFDNSWAVALVTIWNDLTVPSNGLGRLVTAMQLQAEATLMIEDRRPADALSVLELAVLFTLYPVHHEPEALAAWHRSLASNHTLFASRRLSLARTLALMCSAQAAVGANSRSVDALEAAAVAGTAANELFAIADAGMVSGAAAAQGGAAGVARMPRGSPAAGSPEQLQLTLAEVARSTARLLSEAEAGELERLMDKRGLKCRWNCGRRSALLTVLVPALRVPLRLVEGEDGEEGARVEPPLDLDTRLRLPPRPQPPDESEVARLGSIFAQVVATLQQPLLSDVGIQCSGGGGQQLLHRCRDQAAAQFAGWADGRPAPSEGMAAMLSHVAQVEEALWRLDQVLDRAMTGVRLGDGTAWVKSRGYTWTLGSYMAAKLYPQGQGAPVYYQARRPAEPHVGSTICLDKTYLLDTVLRLDPEGLRGLQYALDNLHYAQFHAGGAEAFWRLLAKDNPLCAGAACQTGDDPLASLVTADGGVPLPAAPRPLAVDFRVASEQALQANLAAATDPSHRPQDPFVAAFLSICLVSCASLYLYNHRGRIKQALAPVGRRSSQPQSGASALAQRAAATGALRDAIAADSISRLHAAIDAAEATGVEKPLVRKARAALQALRKRKQQGGGGGGHHPAASSQRTAPQQAGSARGGAPSPAAPSLPPAGGLSPASSTLSAVGSSTGGSLRGSAPAALLAADACSHALCDDATSGGSSADSSWHRGVACNDGGGSTGTSAAPSPRSARRDAARTPAPPRNASPAPHLTLTPGPAAALASETPSSPGTPAESVPRSSSSSVSQAAASSAGATPLPSPRQASSRPSPARQAAATPPRPAPPSDATVTLAAAHTTQPAAGEQGSGAAPARQLTPRQLKKLLRLQQKHAAAAAGLPHPPSVSGSEDQEAAAVGEPTPRPPSPPSSTASPAKPAPGARPRAGPSPTPADEGRPLTAQELAALAAREESAPSKQPRSAKKKAGRHATPSTAGSEASSGAAGRGGAAAEEPRGVRRTTSDPLAAARALASLSPGDARSRHASRWPAPPLWSPSGGASERGLNAHAPEFSPSPGRLPPQAPQEPPFGSPPQLAASHAPPLSPDPLPGGGMAACGGGGALRRSPFGGEAGGGLPRTRSVPFSPDSSLSHFSSSAASSLDPQQSAAAAAMAAASAAPPPNLLAQLQQIWGDPGAAAPHPLPGFGAPLLGTAAGEAAAAAAAAATVQQQQQQLAALLFMHRLEEQQRVAGGGAALDGPPASPQQLPDASADLLREVLGSPLALLPGGARRGSAGSLAWAALGGGGEGVPADGSPSALGGRCMESLDLEALGFTESGE